MKTLQLHLIVQVLRLATANGQIYCELETTDRTKWVYPMVSKH